MAWLDDQLTQVTQSPAAAGMVGSLLSLRWVPGSSWMNKLCSFAFGMGLALFVVPWIVVQLGITSQSGPPAFGFLAGLMGLNILSKLWDYVAQTPFGELLTSFFTKRPQ